MKNFLLLLFLLVTLIFEKSYAQTYDRFVIEGAHWEVYESECDGCNNGHPYPQFSHTHFFKLEGDTTINFTAYKKLYHSYEGDWQPNAQDVYHYCSPWTYQASLREDTLLKKIFIVGSIGGRCSIVSSVDTLLFDFSLTIGDSSRMFMASPMWSIGCNDSIFTVDSVKIDSFQTYNVHLGWKWWKRKTQFLNPIDLNGIAGYKMYEGIGPSFGLFGAPPPTFEGVYSTNLMYYCIGNDSICGYGCIPTAINEVTKTSQIVISPNPFSNQLTFAVSNSEHTTISLYNFLGQQILQQSFTNSITLNTAPLAAGIYFYELRNNKRIVKKGKVVKE